MRQNTNKCMWYMNLLQLYDQFTDVMKLMTARRDVRTRRHMGSSFLKLPLLFCSVERRYFVHQRDICERERTIAAKRPGGR